jgi:diguanylate cyclase (GGDEF)-like protein/PAS domain S-box-containing protein
MPSAEPDEITMSLRYRIAATIFALEVVLIGAVLWITLGHSLRITGEQIGDTEEVTLQLLADLSRASLITDEFSDLQMFIEGTTRDPRIITVLVGSAEGHVVAATEPELIGAPFPELVVRREHRYWKQIAIRGRAGALGTLAIKFSNQPLMHAYEETRNLGISIAIIGMVAIAIVGVAMGFLLTRRLGALALAADRAARGELAVRLAPTGTDEVARVGRAFDSMMARLENNLQALKAARDQLIEPTEAMSEGFALWDPEDRLIRCNRRLRRLLRPLDGEIAPGMRFADLARLSYERVLGGDPPGLEEWLADRMASHRDPHGPRELQLRDGRWLSISEFRTAEGGRVGIYTDVTEDKKRQRAIEQGEQRLRATMNAVVDGILTVGDDGVIDSGNPAAAGIFGCAPDQLAGMRVGELVGVPEPAVALGGPSCAAALDITTLPRQSLLEVVGHRRDGTTFPLELSVADLPAPHRLVVTLRDITARKATEEQILYHATHDALTGLPNRALFNDRLATALKQGARHQEMLAVLFLDLDRFKIINDTLGHTIGDTLLVALSRRLCTAVRAEDTLARMGGDEFIFILRGLKSAEDAVKPAQKILEAIRPPFHVGGHELHVTASIGISLHPADGPGADQLLKCADMALYRAKERGRDRIQLYNPALNVRVFEQMVLEKRLRRAIEQRQFVLVYQPQVGLDSGAVVGFEALLRWRHPDLGLVPPDEFVPLAEENGLIEPLGSWVLRTACAQHRAWRAAGLPVLRLAVNMSARQFQGSDLDQRIRDMLDQTGMDARCLELELTESVLMQEGDQTASLLADLSELGIGLALDDFGTGYSSLSYLKRFPIRRVKIDRSFVSDIAASEGDAAVARAVIAMAHGLGVAVVAEGIETLEQLAILRRYGCDEGQGYLLGRPVLPAAVPDVVRRPGWPAVRRPAAVV